MAMYLEFVVFGTPISNQQSTAQGKANLTAWRGTIAGRARNQWTRPLLTGDLKAILINFYDGNKPSVDVDNMSKPILDAMQNVVYADDRQIVQAELAHSQIGAAYSVAGVRRIIVNALQAGNHFVYVRLEDAVTPFPLPK
jgi:Holliday junction resolvase RusA-like endonuclease